MTAGDFGIGSTASRVIDHLRTLPAGAECMLSGLLDAVPGVTPPQMVRALDEAVAQGAIFRRKREDLASAPWWWSITRRVERRTLARAPTPMSYLPTGQAPKAPPTDIQPRRESSAPQGLSGDPGRPAHATAQAIPSTPEAPPAETTDQPPSGGLWVRMCDDGGIDLRRGDDPIASLTPSETLELAAYFGAFGQ